MYLDYVNNFLSLEYFAIVYKINIRAANHIINTGRLINNKKINLN